MFANRIVVSASLWSDGPAMLETLIPSPEPPSRLVSHLQAVPNRPKRERQTTSRHSRFAALLVAFWFVQIACPGAAFASDSPLSAPHREDRILIQPKAGKAAMAALARFHRSQNVRVVRSFEALGALQVLRLPPGAAVADFTRLYERSGLVVFAEPDYVRSVAATFPNDPAFLDGTLWGLHNTGQNGGTPDADIDAPEAWDVLTAASNIVVAVLDTGVRHTHEDLAENMWINPIDGGYGFNAFTGTNNPADDHRHGTLMAGIIGAVGNNGLGVAGVAWRVQLMACKAFDSTGNGSDSGIIACIDYARNNGARVISASFDGPGFSQSVSNAVRSAGDSGIIFVASAGNLSTNIDATPRYPAALQLDNVVAVAYTTRNDTLGFLSNYGATNVHLAAPGDQIYSTSHTSDSAYFPPSFLNVAGTSYAAAYVAGAFALMIAKFPDETHQQLISRVLNGTDPLPSLAGKCRTGGRLNLRKALSPPIHLTALPLTAGQPLRLEVTAGPNRTCVIEATADFSHWFPLITNTTLADGAFEFADPQSTNTAQRFYRVVSGL
jgi:subtilisin family serine protease